MPVLERANLRARVFVLVFAVACLASLSWVFLRPPVYVSAARVQVEAPRSQRPEGEGDRSPNLLTAAQALTSSVVLENVLQRVRRANPGAADAIGSPDALRTMLTATPVEGTNVIELQGEGGRRELLPLILDSWIEAYRVSQADTHDRTSIAALDETRKSVQQLKDEVAVKRRELDQFRKKADIVSLEREENQATARLKGLNTALNDARTKEVNAETRVSAMRDNLAAGKLVLERTDRGIIADLEKRAIDLREKMKDLEHEYTASYLALDPKYKALRSNLTRLEQQIERERKSSAQQSLQVAEEELTSARQAVQRIQGEITARKREVQDFTTRFAEHTALVGELKKVEETYDGARQRLLLLEGERRAAGPQLTVLSQPSVPDRPVRPDYWRDALIAVAGSGLLGLISVWLIEFLRRAPAPSPEFSSQPVIHVAYAPNALLDAAIPVLNAPPAPRLTEAITVAPLPRELSAPEVHALWAAASPDARLVIAAQFGGMTIEELVGLRYDSIDFEAGSVYLGNSNRSAALREPFKRLLTERQARYIGGHVLADARGAPMPVSDLEGLITCAAVDAGLANPSDVNSQVLRHTYLAYLVRQGARLADVGAFIGQVAPADLREYGKLSPAGPGLSLEQVDTVFPALRGRVS